MAVIDLETLQITIAANTASLERVTPAIRKVTASVTKMQKTVTAAMEKVSSSFIRTASAEEKLTASTRKAEAAMVRKKVALLRAETAVENLQSRISRLNAVTKEEQAIVTRLGRQANVAYNIYTDAVRRAAGSTTKLALANARLRKDLAGVSRVVGRQNFKKAETQQKSFARTMSNLTSVSVLAVGPLSGVGARIGALGAIVNRANLKIAAIVIGISGLTIGFGALAVGAVKASLAMEKINAGLRVATGSSAKAKVEFGFISEVADQLGQDLTTVALQYSKLAGAVRGTSITLSQARDIFKGVSLASTALQLSGDETAGMFRALQQIASKGTVQMEELRGQFGERMPGALALAADAMGITIKELTKMTGEAKLSAEVFLPKLAAQLIKTFGGPAEQAAQSLRAEINRFKNSILLFNVAFDESVGVTTGFRKAIELTSSMIDFFTRNMKLASSILISLIASALTFMGLRLALSFFKASEGASIFALALVRVKKAFQALLLLNPRGWIILLTSAVVGATTFWWQYAKGIDGASVSVETLIEKVKAMKKAAELPTAQLRKEINLKIVGLEKELVLEQAKIDAVKENIRLTNLLPANVLKTGINKANLVTAQLAFTKVKNQIIELDAALTDVNEIEEKFKIKTGAVATTLVRAANEVGLLADGIDGLRFLLDTGEISLVAFNRELLKMDVLAPDKKALAEFMVAAADAVSIMTAVGETPMFPAVKEESTKVAVFFRELAVMRLEDARLAREVMSTQGEIPTFPDLPPAIDFPDDIADLRDRSEETLRLIKLQTDAMDTAKRKAQEFSSAISATAVATIAAGGTMREAIGNVIRSLAAMVAQAWLNFIIMRALGFNVSAPNFNIGAPATPGVPSPIVSGEGQIPGMASGGSIRAGQLAMVGEDGAELFRPNQSGTIIPNGAAMGGITINIDATGAEAGVEERILSVMQNFEERAVAKSVNTVLTLRQRGQI